MFIAVCLFALNAVADCVLPGKFPGAPKINLPAPADRYFCGEQDVSHFSTALPEFKLDGFLHFDRVEFLRRYN